jgi:magnesium transporter
VAEWVDLLDPEKQELERVLPGRIHDRALELLREPARHDDEPRPRLEGHDHYVFGIFLVPICVRAEDRVYYQEVDLVATRDTVVTVRKTPEHGQAFDITPARDAVAAERESRAGAIVYRVVDLIAEDFLDLVDAINDEIDELEDGIEEWPAGQVRERISGLRHDLLHVRRTLAPTRDAIRSVVDRRLDVGEGPEVLPRDIELDFGDAYDKLLRAVDGLDLSRDLLSNARDYHQAKVANDQNEVMKRLTVIASVLLLPTFIVGLYGQNFHHIPELGWRFGYWWSWALIVATTLVQLAFFRAAGWIGDAPWGRPKMPPLRRLDPRTLRGRRRRRHAAATSPEAPRLP